MNLKTSISILFITFLFSCNSNQNSPEFIKQASGRYLYNSDEVLKVYFEKNELFIDWRGATNIKPLKVDEGIFYVKEMNEKVQFLTNKEDGKDYLVLVPKEKTDTLQFNFRKLESNEKIPSEYLDNNEFDKALEGYLAIKTKDSLDTAINENDLNSIGYKQLRDKNYSKAIDIFKINVALHPESSNVYDSLGEAFMKNGDTLNAIENYKKSLILDSGNNRAKRQLKKLEKKE